MGGSQNEVIRNCFKNLQMELIVARFSERVSPNWGRPLRKDGYNRFYLILGGEGRIQVGLQEYFPAPGQLYYLPADTPLSYGTVSPNTFTKYWCHFLAKVGSCHLSQLIEFPYFIPVKESDLPELVRLFERLVIAGQAENQMTSSLKTNGILYEIMSYYMDNAPSQTLRLTSSPSAFRTNEILRYIEDHLSESLTPKRLAGAFHYNPNYFCRYFKTLFHVSPNEYINKVRIEKAKWLLTHSNLSVEDIAGKIGLERFYFSNLFKKYTTVSPSEYRSLHHAGGSAGNRP
ncbi:helix-turn-helix domain-containing protein [Paenibacillus ehimensis]|uniref:AraC family transcriptional regulator n=1 Tax=Paenibacillus ehimensis TaxID=79264 RepID=A0ABT8VGE3_9BACL|nr:AraC family transcriptional regulator [Paenibacillus ehimensis]MDO3680033.1 AraC family transcriptional regulator [Paenibacillus ehimensis]